jgi:hypothetical protein
LRKPPTTRGSPNLADNLPPPAVKAELLARLDVFLNGYVSGATVGVLERKQRGHLICIGSLRWERERDAGCDQNTCVSYTDWRASNDLAAFISCLPIDPDPRTTSIPTKQPDLDAEDFV